MHMDNQTYDKMRKKASPHSPVAKDCLWAFFVGGAICCLGEGLNTLYRTLGFAIADAGTLTSATLVALSGIFTSLGWYQKLAAKAGAGTLVPITGFANAVVSPAIEFRRRGRQNVCNCRPCHCIRYAGQRGLGHFISFFAAFDRRLNR